jgi:hypothetical protein
MARILRVCWSTNRPEYLVPTLASHDRMVDFGAHNVYHMLVDDYPRGRYDWAISDLAQRYKFNDVVLHPENLGITENWTNLWRWIANEGRFDYVWHHEDDVVFQQPVKINHMIDLLNDNSTMCQVNLKRNPWYKSEFHEPLLTDRDEAHGEYLFTRHQDHFWTMSSLYPASLCSHVDNIIAKYNCNLGEGPVMDYMRNELGMHMAILKNPDGTQMVEHIGAYSQGRRVLPGEPGWDKFYMYDPDKRYNSATGELYD